MFNFASCTWFVHILTVYLYVSIETSTASYIVNPCGRIPRDRYIILHAQVIQSQVLSYTHCFSTACGLLHAWEALAYFPSFWCGGGWGIQPPVLLSSTWRDLFPYSDAQSLPMSSIAPHIILRPGTLTTCSFWTSSNDLVNTHLLSSLQAEEAHSTRLLRRMLDRIIIFHDWYYLSVSSILTMVDLS